MSEAVAWWSVAAVLFVSARAVAGTAQTEGLDWLASLVVLALGCVSVVVGIAVLGPLG